MELDRGAQIGGAGSLSGDQRWKWREGLISVEIDDEGGERGLGWLGLMVVLDRWRWRSWWLGQIGGVGWVFFGSQVVGRFGFLGLDRLGSLVVGCRWWIDLSFLGLDRLGPLVVLVGFSGFASGWVFWGCRWWCCVWLPRKWLIKCYLFDCY